MLVLAHGIVIFAGTVINEVFISLSKLQSSQEEGTQDKSYFDAVKDRPPPVHYMTRNKRELYLA